MRMNDNSIRLRRFQRDKLFSIEYMGYDRAHAMEDYENRVAYQMLRYWIHKNEDVVTMISKMKRVMYIV